MEINTATANARLIPIILMILDFRPRRMDLRVNIIFMFLGLRSFVIRDGKIIPLLHQL